MTTLSIRIDNDTRAALAAEAAAAGIPLSVLIRQRLTPTTPAADISGRLDDMQAQLQAISSMLEALEAA